MTPSTRFALPLLLLTLAAAVPVGLAGGRRVDDCRDPAALLDVSAMKGSRITAQRKPKDAALQRTEGQTGTLARGIDPVDFRILRSYDPRVLYMNPTVSLPDSHHITNYPSELVWVDADGERLPIRLMHVYTLGVMRVVGYLFVEGAGPVAHPIPAQLAAAVPALIGGARPLTLLSATSLGPRLRADEVEKLVVDWLADALRWYRAACVR